LFGEPEEWKMLGRHKQRWEDNIITRLKGLDWSLDWFLWKICWVF
jgi:hypothetical protein